MRIFQDRIVNVCDKRSPIFESRGYTKYQLTTFQITRHSEPDTCWLFDCMKVRVWPYSVILNSPWQFTTIYKWSLPPQSHYHCHVTCISIPRYPTTTVPTKVELPFYSLITFNDCYTKELCNSVMNTLSQLVRKVPNTTLSARLRVLTSSPGINALWLGY